jgi:NAD(P)-dependent dehydrogenase (short-subunit alcohol dehydrogenase family)
MAESAGFQGRIAVVNGGTQGLGEATARLFAERGAAGVMITGRNVERGEGVAADLTATGCPCRFHQVELSDADQVASVMPAVDDAFGAVHVVVNAAALTDRGTIADTSVELWDQMMAVNLRAPFQLMQGAIAIMRREGSPGSIVNIGSVSAHGGQPELLPYAVSKAGLAVATKNTAYAVMADHIRVNQLNLGWMETPAEDAIQRRYHGADDGWLAAAGATRPFGRLIQVDEAARAIAFLASDESGLMTGSIVDFDQSVVGAGDASVPEPRRG